MKNNLIIACLSVMLLAGLVVTNQVTEAKNGGMIEEAIDANNETIQLNVRDVNVGANEEVSYSNTFVQAGVNTVTGRQVLRFATAVSGPIKSLKYVRAAEGLETKEKSVDTLYKGLLEADRVAYYDGNEIVYEQTEATNNYYWACYTVEFKDDTNKGLALNVKLEVTGENEEVYMPQEKVAAFNDIYVAPVVLSRLEVTGNDTINHGEMIGNRTFEVKGIYSDGSERVLEENEYTVTAPTDEYARFGKEYKYTFTSTENTGITISKSLKVTQRIQGETGTVVGGTSNKSEPEYTYVDGKFVKGAEVSFAGGFSKAVNGGKEGSVTIDFDARKEGVGGFDIRMSNSNLQKDDDGYYHMEALQLNKILDIFVNGEQVAIDDSIILPGTETFTETKGSYAPLYGVYHTVSFDHIAFKTGINKLKLSFKKAEDILNSWNESPSESNIDYVDFHSTGAEINEDCNITALEIDPLNNYSAPYGTLIQDAKLIPVRTIATLESGEKIALDPSEVKITNITTDAVYDIENEENYVLFGTYQVEVSLLRDENIKATFTFTNAVNNKYTISNAKLQNVDGRVLYILSGTGTGAGLSKANIELFDGTTIYAHTATFGINDFTLTVDITDYAASSKTTNNLVLIPHARVDGVLYPAHKSGDVINVETNFDKVFANKKAYYITTYYNMPAVYIDNFTFGEKHLVIDSAKLIEEGEKVYYTLGGYFYGEFANNVLQLFDGSVYLAKSFETNGQRFEMRVDCSTITKTFYPHLKDGNTMYPTGKAGDVKGFGLVVEAKTVGSYKLSVQYDMPVLTVS